ncbi:MAG: hypothetical protein E2O61_15670 [Gammaproteobacteria bacterium]|nr:MAG: hypothetical protein E2O61_15670 [Gammaproteobacteria bacterium]
MKRLFGISATHFGCLVIGIATCLPAQAAVINFGGALAVILEDAGGAVYSGVPTGSNFFGSIDDVSSVGFISDGTTMIAFGCCVDFDTPGVELNDDFVLDADTAELINSLAGTSFVAGDLVDLISVEGDVVTAGGTRIEIGWNVVLDPLAFSDNSLSNYPFDSEDVLTRLIIINEFADQGGPPDPPIYSSIVVLVDPDKRIAFANPASNQNQQGFVRVVNKSSATGLVTMSCIDKDGNAAPSGDLTFTLGPNESKQFNSLDYENGNAGKGLVGELGDGTGKWQCSVTSGLDLEIMSLIRTPDGFVTSVTDVVPVSSTGVNEIYFGNPASNQNQQSFLRVVNKSSTTGLVTVSGIDKDGNAAPGGDLTFTLGPNESKGFNSLDYENGNPAKGLTGALGDGAGKWWLSVTSPLDLEVMSLIRSPDGFLTNLSGVTPKDDQGNHRIFFANSASNLDQQTFIRVINTSDAVGMVIVSGVDDEGFVAPGGDVQFELGPFASKGMNIQDLEVGNAGKGLLGALGDGSGRWQLTVSSALALQVMNMIRTADGFVTNLSQVTPKPQPSTNDVFFVNPGTNLSQRSFLRLVNKSGQTGSITISGIDDAGNPAPGGDMTLSIGAFAATEITAADLENGNVGAGLMGALGNGSGKWRLSISSDVDLEVMSLLDTPAGFLTNLSRVVVP